jgi:hypothetical protein
MLYRMLITLPEPALLHIVSFLGSGHYLFIATISTQLFAAYTHWHTDKTTSYKHAFICEDLGALQPLFHDPSMTAQSSLWRAAGKYCSLPLLQKILAETLGLPTNDLWYGAAFAGRIDILQALAAQRTMPQLDVFRGAAAGGSLSTFKRMQAYGHPVSELRRSGVAVMCLAARSGHLAAVQWLYEQDCFSQGEQLADAFARGTADCVAAFEWMREECLGDWEDEYFLVSSKPILFTASVTETCDMRTISSA